jgi:hypothetical protein
MMGLFTLNKGFGFGEDAADFKVFSECLIHSYSFYGLDYQEQENQPSVLPPVNPKPAQNSKRESIKKQEFLNQRSENSETCKCSIF